MLAASIKDVLGTTDPHETFKSHWQKYGFPRQVVPGVGVTTPSIQSFLNEAKMDEKTKAARQHWLQKKMELILANSRGQVQKDVDATLIKDNIPIMFDPEILDILTDAAPLMMQVPHRGWEGFTVATNRLSARDAPLGYRTEAFAMDLSAQTGKDFTMDKDTTDQKIYVDLVNISDFSQRAGEYYVNLRETALGTRVAEHAQLKEQTILYGKPVENTDDGSPGDAAAYNGLSELLGKTDKSGVSLSGTQALLKDIKAEIKGLLQAGLNITASDLQIWTSYDLHDYLENEMQVAARIEVGKDTFNFGYEGIRIKGIPVLSSHNVDSHTYGGYTPGDPGDVFIYNKRATQFFGLTPLSTIPLGRVGLAERAALYEFGVLHERAGGVWGKYLSAYNI